METGLAGVYNKVFGNSPSPRKRERASSLFSVSGSDTPLKRKRLILDHVDVPPLPPEYKPSRRIKRRKTKQSSLGDALNNLFEHNDALGTISSASPKPERAEYAIYNADDDITTLSIGFAGSDTDFEVDTNAQILNINKFRSHSSSGSASPLPLFTEMNYIPLYSLSIRKSLFPGLVPRATNEQDEVKMCGSGWDGLQHKEMVSAKLKGKQRATNVRMKTPRVYTVHSSESESEQNQTRRRLPKTKPTQSRAASMTSSSHLVASSSLRRIPKKIIPVADSDEEEDDDGQAAFANQLSSACNSASSPLKLPQPTPSSSSKPKSRSKPKPRARADIPEYELDYVMGRDIQHPDDSSDEDFELSPSKRRATARSSLKKKRRDSESGGAISKRRRVDEEPRHYQPDSRLVPSFAMPPPDQLSATPAQPLHVAFARVSPQFLRSPNQIPPYSHPYSSPSHHAIQPSPYNTPSPNPHSRTNGIPYLKSPNGLPLSSYSTLVSPDGVAANGAVIHALRTPLPSPTRQPILAMGWHPPPEEPQPQPQPQWWPQENEPVFGNGTIDPSLLAGAPSPSPPPRDSPSPSSSRSPSPTPSAFPDAAPDTPRTKRVRKSRVVKDMVPVDSLDLDAVSTASSSPKNRRKRRLNTYAEESDGSSDEFVASTTATVDMDPNEPDEPKPAKARSRVSAEEEDPTPPQPKSPPKPRQPKPVRKAMPAARRNWPKCDELQFCHPCRMRSDKQHMLCAMQDCTKAFCVRCVVTRFPDVEFEYKITNWMCLYCSGQCSCDACCRKRGEEYIPMRPRNPRNSLDTQPEPLSTRDRGKAKVVEPEVELPPLKFRDIEEPTKYWGVLYGSQHARRVGSVYVGADGKDDVVLAEWTISPSIQISFAPLWARKAKKTPMRLFVGAKQDHWSGGEPRFIDEDASDLTRRNPGTIAPSGKRVRWYVGKKTPLGWRVPVPDLKEEEAEPQVADDFGLNDTGPSDVAQLDSPLTSLGECMRSLGVGREADDMCIIKTLKGSDDNSSSPNGVGLNREQLTKAIMAGLEEVGGMYYLQSM